MTHNIIPDTCLFVALDCESKPLIKYFQLKKLIKHSAFSIYANQHLVLTITGVGKLAMAGGVAYTLAHFTPLNNPILINIGIAGHASWAIGSLMMAMKVTDFDSGQCFFPQLLPNKFELLGEVCTLSSATTTYCESAVYEMEAAGFYEIAVKFSTLELIHCLKVISDNRSSSFEKINAKQVESWIYQQLPSIDSILKYLTEQRQTIMPYQPEGYTQLLTRWHFSITGEMRLKMLLTRWQVLTGQPWSVPANQSFQTSKQVLKKLLDDIEHLT